MRGAPDQPLEEKSNGVLEDTLTKEIGENVVEQAVAEENQGNRRSKRINSWSSSCRSEKPKDVFVVKDSKPEVELAAIEEAPLAKENDPESSEEPEKLAPDVDGGQAAAEETAE